MNQAHERGRALEERVGNYFAEHGYRVQLNVVRAGRSTSSHEIDVLAEKTDPLTTYRVIVECKAWSTPIEKEVVAKLDFVKRDLGFDKGIIVSLAGCRSGAQAAADQHGIELWGSDEVEHRLGREAYLGVRPGRTIREELALPVTVSPADGERSLGREAKGFLGVGREELTWWSLVWAPGFEYQLAVTRHDGPRRQRSVVQRSWNAYEALSGRLLGAQREPRPAVKLDLGASAIRHLIPESSIPAAIRKAVKQLHSVTSETAVERHAATVRALGVPVPVTSVDPEETRTIYFPFYIGLLQRGSRERFVSIYARSGKTLPAMTHALNENMRHVRECLTSHPGVGGPTIAEDDTKPVPPGADVRPPEEAQRAVPASAGACACGGELMLRHRRSDNEAFFGCSRFPSCRMTRPAT